MPQLSIINAKQPHVKDRALVEIMKISCNSVDFFPQTDPTTSRVL